MKTYWDFSEKERSEMTEEQVQDLMDLHLMEKGVLKVLAPKLVALEPEPELKKVTLFEVEGILFDTAEKAQAFLDLNPKKESYDYSVGYDFKYPNPIDQGIKKTICVDHQSLLDHAVVLKKNNASKKSNDNLLERYREANKKVEACTGEVWEDYREQQEKARRYSKTMETWNEYLKLTEGNEELAKTFLLKAIEKDEVEQAFAWFK